MAGYSGVHFVVTYTDNQNGNFTADVYEEVVACYRALAKQLMEGAETIIDNQSKWNELKNTSIETLKRMLRAG